jgi:hypothetical protein
MTSGLRYFSTVDMEFSTLAKALRREVISNQFIAP